MVNYPRTFWARLGLVSHQIEDRRQLDGTAVYWQVRVIGVPYWAITTILACTSMS